MNKKLILGIAAAAVAAVAVGAAAAIMTSSTPEKIDLSSTHTTEAPKETETTAEASVPETTAPETTSGKTETAPGITASISAYTTGGISIEYPQVDGVSDADLEKTLNETLRSNALSVVQGYGVDESADTLSVKCQVISVDSRRLTAVYTGVWTPKEAAYPANLFYSNTLDLREAKSLGLNDFTDSYTMAGYVLSGDVQFSGLTDEQTAAVLEYRQTQTIESFTDLFNQADFPIQEGVAWPPSFSYEKQGSIFFTIPVPHALGDYVTVRFDPSTK